MLNLDTDCVPGSRSCLRLPWLGSQAPHLLDGSHLEAWTGLTACDPGTPDEVLKTPEAILKSTGREGILPAVLVDTQTAYR
jgi:hypothetical protein